MLIAHPALLLAGFGLGLSLIVAIGAQNAFVLRQGARREHLVAVLLVCIVSDVVLIVAGVAGFGTILAHAPWAIALFRWFGVAFLLGYGLLAAKRAWRPAGTALRVEGTEANAPTATDGTPGTPGTPGATTTLARPTTGTRRALPVVLTALALTWLNPHVYLDTVVLLGSVANTHGSDGRWVFAIGACLGSVVWFTALGAGARMLSRWLATPRAWRILDGVIAVVMVTLALSLALGS
ncbi:MAG: L-lysine exporter [Cryobacterium sp.]|nr:L-lysine exporter [Cryobacterium sp.]